MTPWASLKLVLTSLLATQRPILPSRPTDEAKLITRDIDNFIKSVLQAWDLPGLAVGLVRRDSQSPTGWYEEFASYGKAKVAGTPVTPDTVFAIASNSKLFTAIATGLLITNETLKEERGIELSWTTKARALYGDIWKLWDEEASHRATIQDMLAHRTGLPGHDVGNVRRNQSLADKINTLRYLRPSAEFRETWQYSNLMYDSLSYLPEIFLNQSFTSYVDQHIFQPLGMSSTTYSVAKAEEMSSLADGFVRSGQDLKLGLDGIDRPIVPFFVRPGDEDDMAGSAGVLASTRDLTKWVAMLLNNGAHPVLDKIVVLPEVVKYTATGASVFPEKQSFPEVSATVYGAGQITYSYRGHKVVEHNGGVPGFDSWISRLPDDNLGIVLLCNDERSQNALSAIKWRLIDEIVVRNAFPSAPLIDWKTRYESIEAAVKKGRSSFTPRPTDPAPPSLPFTDLQQRSFSHGAYGTLKLCLVPASLSPSTFASLAMDTYCQTLLDSLPVRRILNITNLSVPTFIAPLNGVWTTHLRLSHFSGNLFNTSVIWTNGQTRLNEGYGYLEGGRWKDDNDVVIPFIFSDVLFEWMTEGEEGLALTGNAWNKGPEAPVPAGSGKEGAEVWFTRVV